MRQAVTMALSLAHKKVKALCLFYFILFFFVFILGNLECLFLFDCILTVIAEQFCTLASYNSRVFFHSASLSVFYRMDDVRIAGYFRERQYFKY
jgi:hypothetical protein